MNIRYVYLVVGMNVLLIIDVLNVVLGLVMMMHKYVKHRKSLDSKSCKNKKSDKEKEDSFSRSYSVESIVTPLGSIGSHSSGGGISEARVLY